MAPITGLLFCYRRPSLSPSQFRTYIEETHVPLVKSLLGANHPATHTRYFTNKDSGFMVGAASSEDPDLIAVMTFESEEAMKRSMQARRADGTREIIEADEDKFMDRSKVKVVVLGEGDVGRTERDGADDLDELADSVRVLVEEQKRGRAEQAEMRV
ncbi:hypothetical protein H2200_011070 [Cladophialophora chaetospira]|uniref:EthD domain-containing protein n=1 Tax=Cladophialophora chaetospira TaxID=386627 RepID=A0AA39CDG3_9EURO|nr:hypothetical protein H2200_011070 [Cladophialophora chaetospira]